MKPNIIIITTDQQRYDTLHCNGSNFMKTPNLDSLAELGVRFERGYCTNPVCTPSRVSIMTGMHMSEHGSYNIGTVTNQIDNFLSSVLTNAGYRTHHIGKAHFYPSDVPSQENRPCNGMEPFQNFAGFQTAELTVGHNDWGISSHYKEWLKLNGYEKEKNPDDFKVNLLLNRDAYATGEFELPLKYHSSSWIVDRVKNFLEHRDQNQPFYLNVGFQDPHHPHVLPKDFTNRVALDQVPKPNGDFDRRSEHMEKIYNGSIEGSRFASQFGIAGNQNTKWCDYFQNDVKTLATRRQYYSMIQLIDEQVGQILKLLRDKELMEHSIVIFTSDHGEMLGDHELGQKGPLAYEEVIRVPLLLSYPDKIKAHTVSDCVSLSDLYPTILDYINLKPPIRLGGYSLRSLLEENLSPRKGVRVEFKEDRNSIRYKCFVTQEWKLVLYMEEEFGELYHLSADPGENRNLYYESDYINIKYKLIKLLLEDIERCEPMNHRPSRC